MVIERKRGDKMKKYRERKPERRKENKERSVLKESQRLLQHSAELHSCSSHSLWETNKVLRTKTTLTNCYTCLAGAASKFRSHVQCFHYAHSIGLPSHTTAMWICLTCYIFMPLCDTLSHCDLSCHPYTYFTCGVSFA